MGDSRADKLQEGVYNAISYYNEIDQNNNSIYTIHKFDGEGNIKHLLTSKNLEKLYNSLVPPNGLAGYGRSTAIKDALFQAINVISQDKDSEMKMIVLFTDGYSNTDMVKYSLSEVIRNAISNNINIVVVGFGEKWFGIGGAEMLGGLLAGVTTCGVLMAIFQSNAGGAWDNAKKMIEEQGKKGTEAHKAAVVGDTVGDPFKDTSGPSLNILLKLMSVVALVIAPSLTNTAAVSYTHLTLPTKA